MEQRIPETISEHMMDKVIESSQHGFIKEKLCLINLMYFYNEMTGSMNERSALDVVYLNFNKTFGALSCNITDSLMNYRLHEWTGRWIGKWLNCQASVVINGTKASWRSATSGGVCQALILGPCI